MSCYMSWLFISLLGQNIRHPQVKGVKVYFSSKFIEVSVLSQLCPRQGDEAEEHHSGERICDVTNSKVAPIALLSLLHPIQAVSLLGGTTYTWGKASVKIHLATPRTIPIPISELIGIIPRILNPHCHMAYISQLRKPPPISWY